MPALLTEIVAAVPWLRGSRSVRVIHFVELVYHADTTVGEHERASFECPFARHWVAPNSSRETDGARTLSRGVHGSRRDFLAVLEQLRLGRPWITKE